MFYCQKFMLLIILPAFPRGPAATYQDDNVREEKKKEREIFEDYWTLALKGH